jgi:hypothetical protein
MVRPAGWLALAVLAGFAVALFVTLNHESGRAPVPAPADRSSPEEYRRQLAEAFRGAPLVGSPTSVRALREWADTYRRAAGELGDITPPRDAVDMHARLAHGLEGWAAYLDRRADAGPAGVAAYQEQLAAGSTASELEWTQAFSELFGHGYVTFGPENGFGTSR